MNDYREIAKQYIDNGYSVIPVSKTKCPAIRSWSKYMDSPMSKDEVEKHFKSCWGMGFICGNYSSTVAIDVDTKYFLDSNLYEDVKEKIPNSILSKLYVQSTTSGGWHWLFKVDKSVIKGNQKLASRHTTAYEKDITYRSAYQNPQTRDNALKMAISDASRVMFETREHGGFIVMSPSPGYKHIYGKIGTLTVEEYELLIDTIRSYNEFNPVDNKHKVYDNSEYSISPFEDFCENGDILSVLYAHGWDEVDTRGNSVRLKRPGSSHSKSSALFDMNTKIFNCFSTSSIFEPNKGYNGASVYNTLENDGDWSLTFKELVEIGYGKK